MIDYLSSGTLAHNDTEARRVVAESEHYSLLDDTLFHLHRPRTKEKHKLTPVVQQLCLPRTLRDEVIKAYHRLNGSSSSVLTATSLSYGKSKNSTPHRIKTSDPIEIKFGMIDYLGEMTHHAKFHVNSSKGGFPENG